MNDAHGRGAWWVPLGFVSILALLQAMHPQPLAGTVENDFARHLARASSWRAVFTVDGFYGFGYALLLRLVSLVVSNPFLAAKLLAVLAAGLSLRVVHSLARELAGERVAFAAQLCLAVNWYFLETAWLVGTDQVASLLALLSIRSMLLALRRPVLWRMASAGALVAAASLVRHTALVLLIAFLAALAWHGMRARAPRQALAGVLVTLVAAAAVGSPQMWLSWRQHGTLFHQKQAQNVWFGMHGGWDWRQWERGGDTSLLEIVREEPREFAVHWASETLRGTVRLGLMIVDLFPRYLAQRQVSALPRICDLLTLLAMAAIAISVRPGRLPRRLAPGPAPTSPVSLFLALTLVGWVLAVGLAFAASRFLLTPWILCLVGAVHAFYRWCAPADVRWDARLRVAQAIWLGCAAVNTSAALWATARAG